jgi:hypothetical protein
LFQRRVFFLGLVAENLGRVVPLGLLRFRLLLIDVDFLLARSLVALLFVLRFPFYGMVDRDWEDGVVLLAGRGSRGWELDEAGSFVRGTVRLASVFVG